jgi:hypothetical protein
LIQTTWLPFKSWLLCFVEINKYNKAFKFFYLHVQYTLNICQTTSNMYHYCEADKIGYYYCNSILYELTIVGSVHHSRIRRLHVNLISVTFYKQIKVKYETSSLANVSCLPNKKKQLGNTFLYLDISMKYKSRH